METVENKYITVAYKLYSIENGEKEFTEEAPAEHPVYAPNKKVPGEAVPSL